MRRWYSSARWSRTSKAAKERDGWRCRECGKAGALEVHHVTARRTRPNDPASFFDLANLRTLCRACHIRIHAKQLTDKARRWMAFAAELK